MYRYEMTKCPTPNRTEGIIMDAGEPIIKYECPVCGHVARRGGPKVVLRCTDCLPTSTYWRDPELPDKGYGGF